LREVEIVNQQTPDKFESWGLVELFGHQRVIGRITEQSVGGANFVRVDVLQKDGAFYTRLFGQGAIYAINITSEEVARALVLRLDQKPVFAYELPQPTQIEGPRESRIDVDLDIVGSYGRSTGSGYDPDEEFEDLGS
jgi:hypothetical protein